LEYASLALLPANNARTQQLVISVSPGTILRTLYATNAVLDVKNARTTSDAHAIQVLSY
jgi:hypothetical protein